MYLKETCDEHYVVTRFNIFTRGLFCFKILLTVKLVFLFPSLDKIYTVGSRYLELSNSQFRDSAMFEITGVDCIHNNDLFAMSSTNSYTLSNDLSFRKYKLKSTK